MMAPTEIRAAREALGWTRADLASAVGVSERTVTRWESGESQIASAARVRLLVRVLGNGRKKK